MRVRAAAARQESLLQVGEPRTLLNHSARFVVRVLQQRAELDGEDLRWLPQQSGPAAFGLAAIEPLQTIDRVIDKPRIVPHEAARAQSHRFPQRDIDRTPQPIAGLIAVANAKYASLN